MSWQRMPPEGPLYGPEKPAACPDGWESHVWTISFGLGSWSLETDCRLCTDGIALADVTEALFAEFQVRLAFDSDHGPDGVGLGGWHGDMRCDCNYWWEATLVQPTST